MDLQNNSATRVAGLDERGVSIERDGKQIKFIPWGEDAEARAAAAAADTKAGNAQKTANEAQTATDTAAAAAAAADTKAGNAQKTANEAMQNTGNFVKKTSDDAQTVGNLLTSQSLDFDDLVPHGWRLSSNKGLSDVTIVEGDKSAAMVAQSEQAVVGASYEANDGYIVVNGLGAMVDVSRSGYGECVIRARGTKTYGELWGNEVAGQTAQLTERINYSAVEVANGSNATGASDFRNYGSIKSEVDALSKTTRTRYLHVEGKNDGSTWARWRETEIDAAAQKITLRRRGQDGTTESREIDLWALATRVS